MIKQILLPPMLSWPLSRTKTLQTCMQPQRTRCSYSQCQGLPSTHRKACTHSLEHSNYPRWVLFLRTSLQSPNHWSRPRTRLTWWGVGRNLNAGTTAATGVSSRHSATCYGISERKVGLQIKPVVRTVVQNLQGPQHAMATCMAASVRACQTTRMKRPLKRKKKKKNPKR